MWEGGRAREGGKESFRERGRKGEEERVEQERLGKIRACDRARTCLRVCVSVCMCV